VLILIAHGSRDARWRAAVESVIDELARDLGPGRVRLAYMDCTPPTLMDVASEGARAGVRRIRVLPLFLATEGHVERDIEPLVEQARKALHGITFELLPPLGQHPEFRAVIASIAGRTERNGKREPDASPP
jgi:sirohydrochlorin cobaltochelatase